MCIVLWPIVLWSCSRFFFIVNGGMFLIITNIPGMYSFSGCTLAFLLLKLTLCNYVMRFLLLSLWTMCDHSNESYWAVLSGGTVYYAVHVQGGSNFWVCGWNPKVLSKEANEQYFPVVLFIMLSKVVLTFESVDEILKCDHSNKS